MGILTSFPRKYIVLFAIAVLGTVSGLAQSDVNNVVLSEQQGNDFHIYIDHRALDMFNDTVLGSLNPDADDTWSTWKDVLTNGNSPGMNVNFDGWNAYGIDSLLVEGAAKLDSTLEVDGYVRMNDSLFVTMYALFQSKISVGDSLVVAGNTDLNGTLEVAGNASTAGTFSITGNTTLNDFADLNDSLDVAMDANFQSTVHITDSLVVAGNTSVAGTLGVTGGTTITGELHVNDSLVVTGGTNLTSTLDVAGNTSVGGNLTVIGTDVDVDATNDISLDAGAASNFTTSAGALTLEGAGGVTVTSTGGGLTLNGTGQTVDLDAATLDVDATTITVDATNTTFTGNVKGPKATADDEFVTYEQLDSLANTAPYNETYKAINLGTVATQTISVGPAVRLDLTGAPGYYYDNSYSVDNPTAGADPAYTTETFGGPGAAAGGGTQFVNLAQSGVYEVHLTMELAPIGSAVADAKVLVEILNNDPAPVGATPNPMTIASDTEIVYFSDFGGGSCHLNLSMIFITENMDEDVYVDITTIGEDVVVESFKFSLTRIGNQ